MLDAGDVEINRTKPSEEIGMYAVTRICSNRDGHGDPG